MLITPYLQRLGFTIEQAGIIFAFGQIAALALTLLFGWVSDKLSPNSGMAARQILDSIPLLIIAFNPLFFGFVVARVLENLDMVLTPATYSFEKKVFSGDKTHKYVSYNYAIGWAASVLGWPVVGLAVTLSLENYETLFLLGSALMFLLVVFPLRLLTKVDALTKSGEEKAPGVISALRRFDRTLAIIIFTECLLYFGTSLASNIVFTYFLMGVLKEDEFLLLSTMAIVPFTIAVLSPLSSRVGTRVSMASMASFGILIYISYSILMGVAKNIWVVVAAMIFQGIALTLWFPAQRTMLYKYIPDRNRGIYFAVYGVLTGISSALGILLGTVISSEFFILAPYYFQILCLIFVYALYRHVLRRRVS
jgi:MFS family permease